MNFLDADCTINGNDVKLTVGEHVIKVPADKAAKLVEGDYNGKTVVIGIRPEDVEDARILIKSDGETAFESTIKVYEMLGAEVFLYFDVEGFPMTARVDPRTTARTGDTIKFSLNTDKLHIFDKETQKVIAN